MSYNQRIIILLSIYAITAFSACKTSQGSNSSDILRIDEVSIREEEVEEVTIIGELTQTDSIVVDTIYFPEEIILHKKAVYRIAVILPFQADSVKQAWDLSSVKNFENFYIDPASEIALSFTEGFLMAANDANFDSKFALKFFDDQNDVSAIYSVLDQLEKDSFDLIVGPELKSNLQSIANFSKREGITLVSPFSPSKSASVGNPHYFMIEPSLDQHILTMLDFTLDSIEKPHIHLIHEQNSFGNYYADLVTMYLDAWNDSLPDDLKVVYSTVALGNDLVESKFKLSNHMDADANNVFICNTFNDNFLTHFLPQIQQVKKEQELLVFGMPGWEKSETLRLDYLNTGEVHFTSPPPSVSDSTENFMTAYEDKHNIKPSQTAYTGYELGRIFLSQLDQFGVGYYDNLMNQTITPLQRNYHFTPIKDETGKVARIENTALIIYKIQDFEQVRVR